MTGTDSVFSSKESGVPADVEEDKAQEILNVPVIWVWGGGWCFVCTKNVHV